LVVKSAQLRLSRPQHCCMCVCHPIVSLFHSAQGLDVWRGHRFSERPVSFLGGAGLRVQGQRGCCHGRRGGSAVQLRRSGGELRVAGLQQLGTNDLTASPGL
jgi:hypothetical protein